MGLRSGTFGRGRPTGLTTVRHSQTTTGLCVPRNTSSSAGERKGKSYPDDSSITDADRYAKLTPVEIGLVYRQPLRMVPLTDPRQIASDPKKSFYTLGRNYLADVNQTHATG